jgi:hypothetical protein
MNAALRHDARASPYVRRARARTGKLCPVKRFCIALTSENFGRIDGSSANHFSLIRSILIDSGPPKALRGMFFANFFCAVCEANRRRKISF